MSKTSSIAATRSEVWRGRLESALRTTVACSIAGCTSLYGPAAFRQYLEFPSFMYATAVLIVSDGTVGDSVRGLWHVICSNVEAMTLSLVGLQVVGPQNFNNWVAALAIAVSAFIVGLPESNHLVTKQLAFGQIVNGFVRTVVDGGRTGVAIHPLHAICSTTFGAVAALIAMLLPYPRLAHNQIRKFYLLYAKNTCERFDCNIEAIVASDNSTAVGFISQAKSLSTTGAKLLQSIRSKQDGMHWEWPQTRIFNSNWIDPDDKLQDLELKIRAMNIALSTCTSFPVKVIDEELRGVLLNCRGQFNQILGQQAKFFDHFDATSTSEMKKEIFNKNLSIASKDLPTSFFLYCVHLLLDDSPIAKKTDHIVGKTQKRGDFKWSAGKAKEVVMNLIPSNQSLAFAFKSSLSLGFAVFFGLTYNTENGYWAGLLIALCLVNGRHPTFSLTNARGQGTAMGSIYGIICCFIFKKIVDFSFLPLLPWIFFCSFLRYSRMYGQAGGIAAVMGTLLVVGMKHHDTPSEFALARMVEATIGLLCFVIVEIIFNPFRAATLAKCELSQCLRSLQDCIDQIAIITTPTRRDMTFSSCQALRDGQKKLKSLVDQLEEFTAEAELEPNFWFIPFHNACYRKMLESLSKMADLLLFVAYSMENIMLLSQKNGALWVDLHDGVNENVRIFKNKVSPTLKRLEEITRIKSPSKLENELNTNPPCDIEAQEYPNSEVLRVWSGDEVVDSITGSFLQHLEEMANKTHTHIDEEMLHSQMLFHYNCLGFCTSNLMRETLKIQSEVKELLMCENP